MRTAVVVAVVMSLSAIGEPARAQTQAPGLAPLVPPTIAYQGRLLNADGSPASGTVSITFTLYASATGSTQLWQETDSVTCVDGYFSQTLGDAPNGGVSFAAGLWVGQRYLGIKVGSDPEMVPRVAVTSAPFALLANPTPHAQSHAVGGSDPLCSQSPQPNGVPAANAEGKLDLGWIPTASQGAANRVPVGASTGTLDASWLPAATESSPGAVQLATAGGATGAVQGSDPRLSDARAPKLHAATHKHGGNDEVGQQIASPYGVPEGDGVTGALDSSWLSVVPPQKGGTGQTAPKETRYLCFYLAGPAPTAAAQAPSLPVPSKLQNCTATGGTATTMTAPTASSAWNISINGSGNVFSNAVVWNASSQTSAAPAGGAAVSAGAILAPQFTNANVTNATVCLELTCNMSFQ